MNTYWKDKATFARCRIATMLKKAKRIHRVSFHTPGHKIGTTDITELPFSDNLSCPHGCILQAETEIAEILGAKKSFILTDGSTSGVLSMLYAVKQLGAKKIAFPETAHKSVWNGCALLGLEALVLTAETEKKIPLPATMYALNGDNLEICRTADALLVTSPDYYGNVCDYRALRDFCDREGKWLLIDGAHGGHLHFDKARYAGTVADLWVDGVHKSLPAFTQGAVVSARTDRAATALRDGVDIFRTTSPSYPIMASVEYAVKYPRNTALEAAARAFQNAWAGRGRIYGGEDWTKICAVFGESAFSVDEALQKDGIYSEFCDGNVILFYLSPATKMRDFIRLKKRLETCFVQYPLPSFSEKEIKKTSQERQTIRTETSANTEWIALHTSAGRICARNCGLFPPCSPILRDGDRIFAEHIALLNKAANVYGLQEGRIQVYAERLETNKEGDRK